MATSDPPVVGEVAARGRAPAAGSRPEAGQPWRTALPRARHDGRRWTARKSVLVALSGASALWSALFAALTLFRG